MTQKLLVATTDYLERRTSRRGFLMRVVAVGSAMAIGPVRYLVRPESAWAQLQPSDCSGSRCSTSKFTEFCCSLNQGYNMCPSGTFIAGWWKAKAPTGSAICKQGARYYVDCARFNQNNCTRPPGCVNSSCNCRRTCEIYFSYFNCNVKKQHNQKSWVVCRMVVCVNPCKINGGQIGKANCTCKGTYDNATRFHEACCHCGQCTPTEP